MQILTPADFSATSLDLLEQPGRRIFIKGIGFVSAALLMGSLGGCEKLAAAIRERPTRRRLRTGSAEVDADIDLYRQAVAAMKALAASDPRSWSAQAQIHGTASVGFNFCEHGTDHFFDWHRAYLLYFEQICQKLAKQPRFGLPYWNWNQNVAVHPAFLDTTSTLFLARNRQSMSGSASVTSAALNPIFADSNFFTFRSQLEGTPHNNVHTYIGGTMGGYGSAMDPLFWTHHCMVDYCWYKWNVDLGNQNPNDPAWVNQVNSHFVNADGNPSSATAGVTTLMPLLSYQYESSAIGGSSLSQALRTKAAFQLVEKRIREGADIRFDVRQRLRLSERVTTSIGRPAILRSAINTESVGQIVNSDVARDRVFASIEYAQLPATSDFNVRVFVNLPSATAGTSSDDPHYAGSFAFFGTAAPGAEGANGVQNHHQPRFLVNLTDTLQRLRQTQELRADQPITLQLVPTPFEGSPERADTTLILNAVDIIITPVIVAARPQ
jgi:tyrosinase